MGRAGGSPLHSQIYRRIKGEAVVVDLPGGKTLFALLRSENNVDWASYVYVYLAPQKKGEPFAEQLDNVLEVTGKQTLPRMWPPVAFLKERSAYPMMVTFGDLADPTSVAQVNPDDLAANFGEGAKLKRITVELTNDPVTTGIEKRLGWLPSYYNKQLSGDRFQNIKNKDKGLAAFISAGVFSAGVGLRDKGEQQ
jgi:hypothetical protein